MGDSIDPLDFASGHPPEAEDESSGHLSRMTFRRSAAADGAFLEASAACMALLGHAPERLLSGEVRYADLIHPDDRPAVEKALAEARTQGGSYRINYRIERRQGGERWLLETGNCVRRPGAPAVFEGVLLDVTREREAVQALREEAQNLRSVLSNAPILLFSVDREGHFVIGEGRGLESLGLRPGDWAGLSVFELFDGAPGALASIRRALAGEEVTSIDEMEGVVFETRYAPVRAPDGSVLGTIGVSLDVTQRERALASLRESETRLQAIAEHSQDVIFELDVEGVVHYVSPGVRKLLGMEPRDLIGRSVFSVVHPEDRDRILEGMAASARANLEGRAVFRIRNQSGEWRWVETAARFFRSSGGELRSVGVSRDVTEREEAQRALERRLEIERRTAEISRRFLALGADEIDAEIVRSLEELARLAEADHALMLVVADKPGNAEQRFEWGDAELRGPDSFRSDWAARQLLSGRAMHVRSVDELPEEAAKERAEMLSRGVHACLAIPLRFGDRFAGFVGFESRGGHRTWSEQETSLLRIAGEIFASALRRKRAEEALRESQTQLLQVQKMEAVGRFAGGIAHDFNNLLMVISGGAREVLSHLRAGQPGHEDVLEIRGAAERATSLTRRLLAFARRKTLTAGRIDLNDVIGDMAGMLERLLGEDIELVLQADSNLGAIHGDAAQIEQILVNLSANARDAMPTGGRLLVSTFERDVTDDDAALLGLSPGRHVVLRVADTGSGMDAHTQARVFEPFFTTKDPDKGTGLGLAIVYGIVQDSDGVIRVDSSPGQGTAFEIFFPRRDGVDGEDSARNAAAEREGRETVLLVEDEPAVRRLLRRALEFSGYRVLEATDGEEALRVSADHRGEIHALVSDVIMPRLGGRELARRLMQSRPGLRVLLVSGYPEDPRGSHRDPLPAQAFLQKPFTAEDLISKLQELLESDS
ncbi:MAG: PAS domain S-box protein [Proteobacteria bacterium]|nr:PAS domain S-box protein [Pseudomonadota bacterium]